MFIINLVATPSCMDPQHGIKFQQNYTKGDAMFDDRKFKFRPQLIL